MKYYLIAFLSICCTLLSVSNLKAEYLTPAEAGFRNCALIYYNENYKAEALKPILVKYAQGRPTAQAGYDAVLFLIYSVNGKETLTDETTLADWREQIDIYFHQGINVPELARASRELRAGGFLKERIKVMFSIPWPHPNVNDFGDVDGDGKTEELQTNQGLQKVLAWYISEVAKEMKKYPELDHWGFYMMNEGLSPKYHDRVRCFCKTIHDQGHRAMWIPYYNAPGADVAYQLGFDASIMQSNWTFTTLPDGRGSRRNRLFNTAQWAREHRHGIELEINPPNESVWRDIFAKTLETGTLTGFQQAASATYFGSDFYWPRSSDPETLALYSLWMDYLAGKPIVLPSPGEWTQSNRPDGSLEILYHFKKLTDVRLVDLFYQDIPGEYFTALLAVDGRTHDSPTWTPLGWQVERIMKNKLRPMENITIAFLQSKVDELRITVKPLAGTIPGKPVQVEPDPHSEYQHMTKSFRKPYITSKERPVPTYPDESGRDLVDGVTGGGWKNYVGWMSRCPADVYLDFGDIIEFDEIRLHLLEEKSAAIFWPETIEAITSTQPDLQESRGFGPVPPGYSCEYDFKGDPSSKVSTLKLNEPRKARSLTLRFKRNGWLFLSEIELFNKGRKLATDHFTYSLSQLDRTAKNMKTKYSDDGFMLTDGFISNQFGHGNVGMPGGMPLVATVDMQVPTKIKSVTCLLLDGHAAGVYMPKKGCVRFSDDGKNWSKEIPFQLPKSQKLEQNRAIPVTVQTEQQARYIQVEFVSNGWTFLSEILVK